MKQMGCLSLASFAVHCCALQTAGWISRTGAWVMRLLCLCPSCMYFSYCLVVLLAPPYSWGLLFLWSSDWKQHLYISLVLGAKMASRASPAWLVSPDAELTPSSEVLGSYSCLLCFSHCCAPFSHASSALCVCIECKRGQNTACCMF